VRKVKKNKLNLSDKEFKKIYAKFEKIINKIVGNKNFAIGVSGGSDSLCLAYFSQVYSKKHKNKIHVLIVNHNLRKESASEALVVKKILLGKKIKSTILNWKGRIPKKNIQGNARDIRYSLIHKYCKKIKINYLVTAHHLDDQIENFFIRLLRGSGLTGLSSMSQKVSLNDDLNIIRPFLEFKKIDLKNITLEYFKKYIKDPSNDNDKFLRVRIRKYRSKMESEGLDTSKIIKTINNLSSSHEAINFYKSKAVKKYVKFVKKNNCLISRDLFLNESGEIIFKLFSDILSLVSGSYYPPRSKKIIYLIKKLKTNEIIKLTLGGCIIEGKNKFITIFKEPKAKKNSVMPKK